jgi:hypothetical protein
MFTVIIPEVLSRHEVRAALIEHAQVWDGVRYYPTADGSMRTDLNEAIERDIAYLAANRSAWLSILPR